MDRNHREHQPRCPCILTSFLIYIYDNFVTPTNKDSILPTLAETVDLIPVDDDFHWQTGL